MDMKNLLPLIFTLLLLAACNSSEKGADTKTDQDSAKANDNTKKEIDQTNHPEFEPMLITGTFVDEKSREVILVREEANGEVIFLYSNGKREYLPLTINKREVVDGGYFLYHVKFISDEKEYKLLMMTDADQGIYCTNPDETQQFFEHITNRTDLHFRPGQLMRERLTGTYADTHSGELLMFVPKGEGKFEVWYSDGINPFKELKVVGIDDKQVKVKFQSGDVYTLETKPDAIHTLITKGRDGVQSFMGLFSETDPVKANPAQLKKDATEMEFAKPVTYIYSDQPTAIHLKLKTSVPLKVSYPAYPLSGWKMTTQSDGMLKDQLTGQLYPSLFWETESCPVDWNLSTGFVVKKENYLSFLEDKLNAMGFNARERSEFIQYWLPVLNEDVCSRIHFAISANAGATDLSNENGKRYAQHAQLILDPPAQNAFRLLIIHSAAPSDAPAIPAQSLPVIIRKGLTLVEWGGTKGNVLIN
jgi:hypothetical protein